MEKILLDQKGYEQYLKQIEDIREKIKKNGKDIATFASDDAYGDGWHDNFAYEEATKKEIVLFEELNKKLKGLKDIEIIDEEKKENTVLLGTIVSIKFDGEEEIERYYISGNSVSDMDREIPVITINSPLGRELYRKELNSNFTYEVNGLEYTGKIVKIEIEK